MLQTVCWVVIPDTALQVVCTIHQPSSDICSLFDDTMLLSGTGRCLLDLPSVRIYLLQCGFAPDHKKGCARKAGPLKHYQMCKISCCTQVERCCTMAHGRRRRHTWQLPALGEQTEQDNSTCTALYMCGFDNRCKCIETISSTRCCKWRIVDGMGHVITYGMCRRPLQRNLAEHLLWLAKDRAVAVPTLAKLHSLSWKVHSALEEVGPSVAAQLI